MRATWGIYWRQNEVRAEKVHSIHVNKGFQASQDSHVVKFAEVWLETNILEGKWRRKV